MEDHVIREEVDELSEKELRKDTGIVKHEFLTEIDALPEEILRIIFLPLTLTDRLSCERACREWSLTNKETWQKVKILLLGGIPDYPGYVRSIVPNSVGRAVHVNTNNLHIIQQLLSRCGKYLIELYVCRLGRSFDLQILKDCTSLEVLHVYDPDITNVEGLKNISTLKNLRLWEPAGICSQESFMSITRLGNLETLNLREFALTDGHMLAITKSCPNLQAIILKDIKSLTENGLLHLNSLPKVEKFLLCNVSGITDSFLTSIPRTLCTIWLLKCKDITAEAIFSMIENKPNLVTLIIDRRFHPAREIIYGVRNAVERRGTYRNTRPITTRFNLRIDSQQFLCGDRCIREEDIPHVPFINVGIFSRLVRNFKNV